MGVDHGEVVDVDANVDPLASLAAWRLHGTFEGEDALIRVCLHEPELE